jgi:hypothetical protein
MRRRSAFPERLAGGRAPACAIDSFEGNLERTKGFEPTTPTLQGRDHPSLRQKSDQDAGKSRCLHELRHDASPILARAAPDDLIPSFLAVSDVLGAGWYAADAARVQPGSTVAVVGDVAVGLMGVLAAKQIGAERIIAMSRKGDPR